jgi:hypothetical protein
MTIDSSELTLSLLFNRTSGASPGPGSKNLHGLFGRKGGRLKRVHSHGADRRPSEFNIMGHEGVVSSEYTLNTIQQAQSNTRVTKLELEDVINRQEDPTAIFSAIQALLSDERSWLYIKFIDSIHIRNDDGMDAATQLQNYKNNRQSLWDAIGNQRHEKPIMFQVKLEVGAATSIVGVENMLTVLLQLDMLTSIDFGGALYGVRKQEIPSRLADLCRGSDDSDENADIVEEDFLLQEMIMLSLSCTVPEATPVNNASMLLKACISNLRSLRKSMQEGEKTKLAPSSPSHMVTSAKRNGKITDSKDHKSSPGHMDTSAKRKGKITHSKSHKGKGESLDSSAAEAYSGTKERRRQNSPSRIRSPNRDDGASNLDNKGGHFKSGNDGTCSKIVREIPAIPDFDWAHTQRGASPASSPGKKPDFRWDKPQQKKHNDTAGTTPTTLHRCVSR